MHVSCRGGFHPFFGSVGFSIVTRFTFSAGGKPMSYLSFLFAAQTPTRRMMNVSGASHAAEREVFAEPDTGGSATTTVGDGAIDYRLPSGIASMEHWLDLNA
jgi:hypothetical protein